MGIFARLKIIPKTAMITVPNQKLILIKPDFFKLSERKTDPMPYPQKRDMSMIFIVIKKIAIILVVVNKY